MPLAISLAISTPVLKLSTDACIKAFLIACWKPKSLSVTGPAVRDFLKSLRFGYKSFNCVLYIVILARGSVDIIFCTSESISVTVKPIWSPASLNFGSTTTAFGCVLLAVGRAEMYG